MRSIRIASTSITQGGCASRPGSCYTNILSRRLMPFINLGFSGSGKGEADVARVVALIKKPALLVLDYEANCGGHDLFQKTLPAFISILRDAHAKVPILIISKNRFAQEAMDFESDSLNHEKICRKQCKVMQRNQVAFDFQLEALLEERRSFFTRDPQDGGIVGRAPVGI